MLLRVLLLLATCAPALATGTSWTCPAACVCDPDPDTDPFTVTCSNLHSVPEAIHPAVQVLYLGDSQLGALDGDSFRATQLIQLLYLNSSGVHSLASSTFAGLPNAALIDLRQNSLETVTFRAFDRLTATNPIVLLSGNPWRCDCQLFDETQRLAQIIAFDPADIVCASPDQHSGQTLATLERSSLCPKSSSTDFRLRGIIALAAVVAVALVLAVVGVGYYFLVVNRRSTDEKPSQPAREEEPRGGVPRASFSEKRGVDNPNPLARYASEDSLYFVPYRRDLPDARYREGGAYGEPRSPHNPDAPRGNHGQPRLPNPHRNHYSNASSSRNNPQPISEEPIGTPI